jgi:hypothetical protein
MQPENIQPSVRLGKFAASRLIVSESLAILRQDKEILLFPIFSVLVTLFVTALMSVFFFFVLLGGAIVNGSPATGKEVSGALSYLVLFVDYVVIMFIANFFQAGLFVIVKGRFDGQDLSFSDGISGAMKKSGKIFMWSVISATVGVVLKFIADRSKLLGKILASILGAAWNILTFFSLPALVVGEIGVVDAFKESASVIRKKWGETIIINFGTGLVFFFTYLSLIALFVIAMVVVPSLTTALVGCLLLFIAIIVLSILSSTLNSIFKLAIFIYAQTGNIPEGFSQELIVGAVEKVEEQNLIV